MKSKIKNAYILWIISLVILLILAFGLPIYSKLFIENENEMIRKKKISNKIYYLISLLFFIVTILFIYFVIKLVKTLKKN
jgi:TRAP-type C4-dicarboxylate transport system permease small subunit